MPWEDAIGCHGRIPWKDAIGHTAVLSTSNRVCEQGPALLSDRSPGVGFQASSTRATSVTLGLGRPLGAKKLLCLPRSDGDTPLTKLTMSTVLPEIEKLFKRIYQNASSYQVQRPKYHKNCFCSALHLLRRKHHISVQLHIEAHPQRTQHNGFIQVPMLLECSN